MNRKKVGMVIEKIAKKIEAGEISEAKGKVLVAKIAEKLEKAGKTYTASKLKKIAAEDEESPEEIENIQKAIMAIYKNRQNFLKIKNKRVREVYQGITGQDILTMKMLPFLEMIANTQV